MLLLLLLDLLEVGLRHLDKLALADEPLLIIVDHLVNEKAVLLVVNVFDFADELGELLL